MLPCCIRLSLISPSIFKGMVGVERPSKGSAPGPRTCTMHDARVSNEQNKKRSVSVSSGFVFLVFVLKSHAAFLHRALRPRPPHPPRPHTSRDGMIWKSCRTRSRTCSTCKRLTRRTADPAPRNHGPSPAKRSWKNSMPSASERTESATLSKGFAPACSGCTWYDLQLELLELFEPAVLFGM